LAGCEWIPAAVRVVAWALLLASAGVAAAYGVGGARQRVKNRDRDRQAEEAERLIGENRLTIAQLVRNNAGHESVALDAEIRAAPRRPDLSAGSA
jgi:hypothetical protein